VASDASSSVSSGRNVRQIVVTAPGPQGEAGVSGIQSDEIIDLVSYRHIQNVLSTEWTVNHNLNFYPNVTVYNSAGAMVEGTVNHTNATQLKITFSSSISGKAYLS
jgi:hypothetical protein